MLYYESDLLLIPDCFIIVCHKLVKITTSTCAYDKTSIRPTQVLRFDITGLKVLNFKLLLY